MSGMLLPAIILGSLLFASPGLCDPGPGPVTLTLKNGNTFTADSYRIDGGKIRLKFKVGEAAFSLDEVASIDNASGAAKLLQDAGVRQAGYPSETTAPVVRETEVGDRKSPPAYSAARQEAVRKEDAMAGEIDRFIDQYFSANEAQQEVLDANMDKLMSVFIGDGEGDDAGGEPGDDIDDALLEEEFITGGAR